MKTKYYLSLIFVLCYSFIFGQKNAIEDVILLNSKPYVVRMTEKGEILTFEKDLKNNFASINRVKRKEVVIKDVVLPDEDNVEEIIAMNDDKNMTAKGSEEAVPTNYEFDFSFDHRDATLSYLSVNKLNQIADKLKDNDEVNAHINSFFSESVDVSKILSKNRTNGMRDILILRGIDPSRIIIKETNNKDWANNRVKVSIQ